METQQETRQGITMKAHEPATDWHSVWICLKMLKITSSSHGHLQTAQKWTSSLSLCCIALIWRICSNNTVNSRVSPVFGKPKQSIRHFCLKNSPPSHSAGSAGPLLSSPRSPFPSPVSSGLALAPPPAQPALPPPWTRTAPAPPSQTPGRPAACRAPRVTVGRK